MAEDKNKSFRDMLFRTILSATSVKSGPEDDEESEGGRRPFGQRLDIGAAKDLITSVASWAGKGKDELVQMMFREIGQAVAAMLKEPLTQVIENRKLQITLEFTPRNKGDKEGRSEKSSTARPTQHRRPRKHSAT